MSPKVEMTGFAYSVQGLTPTECWLYVNKNPQPPDSTHPLLTSQIQQVSWAEEQLRKAGVTDKCHVTLSCVGPLPWFELLLPNGLTGLAIYWSSLLVKSVLIVGRDVILNLNSGDRGLSARFYPIQSFKDNLS